MNDDALNSEMATLTVRQFHPVSGATFPGTALAESDEATFDAARPGPEDKSEESTLQIQAELRDRTEIIERLRFDFEQVRAKWLGVQAELQSREDVAGRLDNELQSTRSKLERANVMLEQREQTIVKLQARIEEQNVEYLTLKRQAEEIRAARDEVESDQEVSTLRAQLVRYEGAIAGLEASFNGLHDRHRQTEAYADELRRQLSDLRSARQAACNEQGTLHIELESAQAKAASLETQLQDAWNAARRAEGELEAVREEHAQEIRTLRFELDQAGETLAQNTGISEQLAADLAENRGQRIELERTLTDQEQQSRERIAALEKQVEHLEGTLGDYERKLETRSHAVNALMDELAKQHRDGGTAHVVDSDLLAPAGIAARDRDRPAAVDRSSRVLVGTIDGQELRFPLFKDRLTIGRTEKNDIYLNTNVVSRRHAVVVTEGGATRILDWASKNGVYVNSKRVTEQVLHSGDRVTIGSVEFRFEELPRRENA